MRVAILALALAGAACTTTNPATDYTRFRSEVSVRTDEEGWQVASSAPSNEAKNANLYSGGEALAMWVLVLQPPEGVATVVFAGQDQPDEAAATIGALTRPENKHFRQRRLTQDNRPLASSLMQLLNRQVDHRGQLQQREPELELTQPITRVERA